MKCVCVHKTIGYCAWLIENFNDTLLSRVAIANVQCSLISTHTYSILFSCFIHLGCVRWVQKTACTETNSISNWMHSTIKIQRYEIKQNVQANSERNGHSFSYKTNGRAFSRLIIRPQSDYLCYCILCFRFLPLFELFGQTMDSVAVCVSVTEWVCDAIVVVVAVAFYTYSFVFTHYDIF